ncbi:MAG: DNA sulfur modification protein DndB [Vibrio sp.]|uniref:DNA sulfur modification protein DndB n=1 Tax=Vibrio sp. TaxID=678 RepID=UPI003A846E05
MSTEGYFYNLPAAIGVQAGRCFYNLSIPMGVLVKLLRVDSGHVLDRSQREVNLTRAKKVARYVTENPDSFIIPTVTGVVETPEGVAAPTFEKGSHDCIGVLNISMDCELKLFDGQHRATGIAYALETNPNLRSQSVPVMLFTEMTLAERKLAFTDINQNVSKPAQSLSDAYNSRDPLPQFAIELATTLPCFKELVDFERNTISAKSEYLFPLKTIKDATALLLSGNTKEISEPNKDLARLFWTRVSESMSWGGLFFGNKTTQEIRKTTIATHSVMINAMGLAGSIISAQESIENVDFSGLSKLDYSKSSPDFMRRCIEPETGRMKADKTAIKLCAIRLLQAIGFTAPSELSILENHFFPLIEIDMHKRTNETEIEQAYNPTLNPDFELDLHSIHSQEDMKNALIHTYTNNEWSESDIHEITERLFTVLTEREGSHANALMDDIGKEATEDEAKAIYFTAFERFLLDLNETNNASALFNIREIRRTVRKNLSA